MLPSEIEHLSGGGGVEMTTSSDSSRLSSWFWGLLASSAGSLQSLARALEVLSREELITYQRLFDDAKAAVDPGLCEKYFLHLVEECSEDGGDDFAAWVVMRGESFYEQVRADPAAIQRHLDDFHEAELTGGNPASRWDDSVDREEYRGYQRADMIASPIYGMRFGRDLTEDCYDELGAS